MKRTLMAVALGASLHLAMVAAPAGAAPGSNAGAGAAPSASSASANAMSAATSTQTSARHTVLVKREGVTIEVVVEGSGPTLVLLPSRGRGGEDFDEVAAGFARAGYRVLRPEPRGIGKSVGPMDGITLHDFADDIAMTIRHFGNEPAVVIGHAFGNWVARTTAVDYPKLVRGVVIVAAAAKNYPDGMAEHVARSADLSLPDAERLKSIQYAFFLPGNDASVWLHGWNTEVSRSQRKAGLAIDQSEWWSGGTVPLLDLQAGRDLFKPESSRNEVRDEFGDRVTVKVIPDTGHALIPEAPQAVVDAIVAWEKTIPQAPR